MLLIHEHILNYSPVSATPFVRDGTRVHAKAGLSTCYGVLLIRLCAILALCILKRKAAESQRPMSECAKCLLRSRPLLNFGTTLLAAP